jgi:hypothetical protein
VHSPPIDTESSDELRERVISLLPMLRRPIAGYEMLLQLFEDREIRNDAIVHVQFAERSKQSSTCTTKS